MPSFLDRIAERIPALANLQFEREVQREKQDLDRTLSARPAAAAPALVVCDERKAVWKISVPGQEDRYMCIRDGQTNSDAFVVTVDADKFYRTWLSRTMPVDAPSRQDECIFRDEMHRDYKYTSAAEGFAAGWGNPVPLAHCYVSKNADGQTTVGFTNGVTRTFWLLANRAESFPVQVRSEASARELHRVAGVGPAPSSVGELFRRVHELGRRSPTESSKAAASGQNLLENLRSEVLAAAATGKPDRSYNRFG